MVSGEVETDFLIVTRLILNSPERRVRQRRDAPGAPFSGRNRRAAYSRLCAHSGGKR